MPTVLELHAAPRLTTFLTELLGLLHQRGEALAAGPRRPTAAARRRSPISCCCR